jgi:hypothetical protein
LKQEEKYENARRFIMGRLKKIVDYIQSSSSGAQAKLQIARVGLRSGMNLSLISENTPDNPEVEKKLLRSTKEVLGIDIALILDSIIQEKKI